MSEDTVEVFRALKEHSRTERQARKKSNTDLLREKGVAFTEHNGGTHFVIRDRGRVFDAWPSSGKWRQRDTEANAGDLAVHRQSLRSGVGFSGLLAALNQGRSK